MKTMRIVRTAAIVSLALFIFSSSVFAVVGEGSRKRKHRKRHHHGVVNPKPINAPLDGGLVALLGAAGIAYFVIRKKKK